MPSSPANNDLETFPALRCKNEKCKRPIPLPPATLPDTTQGLGSWPTDGALRNFACPACRHVYEYSAGDVRPFPLETYTGSMTRSVVVVLVPCGVKDCTSHLRIQALAESDADLRLVGPEVIARGIAHQIRCDVGHPLDGPSRLGVPLKVRLDDDWEHY